MAALKLGKVVLGGYDWGGAIALRMAATYPAKITKVIVLLPSLSACTDHNNELKKIKCPVLVEWVPADQFHPWTKFKPMCKNIKSCEVVTVKVHPWKDHMAADTYSMISNQLCLPIIKFLTGKDPNE